MATALAAQRLGAEFIGTALLLATVIGSGIMGERLAGGNVAIALLGNTIPTGAILIVLITMLGPISGAHFNPAVTAVFAHQRRDCRAPRRSATLSRKSSAVSSACSPPIAMFDEAASADLHEGARRAVAMVLGMGCGVRPGADHPADAESQRAAVATSVGLYITAAYWFTASTSFANPAVTIARAFSNTFAGIRPQDVAAVHRRAADWSRCGGLRLPLAAG